MGRPPKDIQAEIDELEDGIESGLLAQKDETLFTTLALAAKRRVLYYRDLVVEKDRQIAEAMERYYSPQPRPA